MAKWHNEKLHPRYYGLFPVEARSSIVASADIAGPYFSSPGIPCISIPAWHWGIVALDTLRPWISDIMEMAIEPEGMLGV